MSSTNPTLINGFEDVMAHIRKLEEENKKLKEELEKYKEYPQQGGWEKALENINGIKDIVIKENNKLGKEIEKLKDFSNWENHPALKHKVVMDDDFYLEHLVDGELIEPEEFTSLKEENEELKEENEELKEELKKEKEELKQYKDYYDSLGF
jgi:predicted  nucleic acid-binding Zn-ribbon protein